MNVSDETIGSKKKKKKYTAESIADDIINGSYESIIKKRLAENEARNKANIAKSNASTSTKTSNTKKSSSSNDRTWFSSGAFSDGYQVGDVTKTILGTAGDIGSNLGKGISRILEGTIDTGAYLLGGGAKLIGQDDFAEEMEEFIKKDTFQNTPTGIMNNVLSSVLDEYSVSGEKLDSLTESGGQLAGTIGLQAVGVPWWVTTGTTSFGSGTQEALQNDATYGQAGAYGLISAGAEILTEKLSGGISFGGKTLDTGLKSVLTKSITNRTLNTLTKFGFDALGEGSEEILASVMQNIGKKLTYEDEKTWNELLTSQEAMDEYLESFIGGAALGGVFNVGRTANSIKTGRDYDTNLSTKEEQVVKAEVEARITEQEATGKTLTNKEKAAIEEEVIEDLKKGYISTDTIENTLGKKLSTEEETAIENQLNSLLEQSKMEMDPNLQTQITEQMKALENQLNASKSLDLSKDSYIQKSYQERELRKQSYTYEKTNNAIEDGLKESASKVMNNTTRTHEFVDTVAKIAKDTNTKYEFTNTEALKEAGYNVEGKTVNGLVTEDGKVLINIDSNKALNTILGHETTHLLEGTAEYQALQDFTKEYAKSKGIYEDTIARLNNLYKGTKADINAELTADLVGDLLFTDQSYIESLSSKQPNVFQKIYNYIKHVYKMATAGSKEARQLEDLKYKFDQAYKKINKQASTDTKYSIQGLESYTDNEIKSIANDYIQQKLEENDLYDVTIKDTAIHGSRGRGTARADSDLDIVVEFEGDIREDDLFSILNEESLEIDGITVDINPITATDTGTLKDYMERSKAYDKEILAKKSTTDNKGRKLTKEQQDFFKDSKARDDNGNLVTVYHGTAFGGFTEFLPTISGKNRFDSNNINFFTSNKDMAISYSDVETYEAERIKTPKLSTTEEVNNVIAEKNKELFEANQEFDPDYSKDNRLSLKRENGVIKLYDEDKLRHTFKNNTDLIRNINSVLREIYGGGENSYGESYYEGYLNITNPYIVDAEGRNWRQATRKGTEWLSTDDIVKKAIDDGSYDGVIIKNVVDYGSEVPIEKPGDLYVTLGNSNQFKNIDNTKPTTDPDIRYSLSEDSQGNKLKPNVQRWAEKSKARDENGRLKVLYHGTATGEFTVFDKSKANAEGDWGAGFYLTDSEYDVESNYVDGGADFDNKVERLAERLVVEEDWDYDEARNEAENRLYKGDYKITAYVNMENPAIVGETRLFNIEEYEEDINTELEAEAENYVDEIEERARESYNLDESDVIEDYMLEEARNEILDEYGIKQEIEEKYIVDDVDKAIWAIENEYGSVYNYYLDTDSVRQVLWEAYYDGGIEIQDLKNKLAEFDLTDMEGNLVSNDVARIIIESLGYDGIIDPTVSTKWHMAMDSGTTHYIAFKPNQIKAITNENPTENPDINLSLSAKNEIAPVKNPNLTYAEDVKLQVEEAIAPLQEKIETLTKQLNTVVNSTEQVENIDIAPKTAVNEKGVQISVGDTIRTFNNSVYEVTDITTTDNGITRASLKSDNYKTAIGINAIAENLTNPALNHVSTRTENAALENAAPVEQQGLQDFENITDEQAPSFEDTVDKAMWSEDFESTSTEHIESPLDSRDIDEVGNRKIKAYQYENPEVKPYFQQEAQNMIYDLDSTIKGERIATQDEEGYITGWNGITRQTTEAIAYLKDNYGYSYDQIRQGLNKIIEDDGLENNAVSKRIEFMLDERLREGYTTSDGIPIPPNQEYINFLNQKNITQYNEEAYNEWQKSLEQLEVPEEITPEPRESVTINQNIQSQQTIPMKKITAQNQNTDVPEGKARSWANTSTESEVVNKEVSFKDLDIEKVMYQPITNKNTLNQANTKLGTLGYSKAVEYFNNQIINKKVSVEDIALGERLIQEAIQQGDKTTAAELIQNVAILGTELGQKVQALSIIQRLTPAGQLKMLDKTINRGKVKEDPAFNGVELTQEMKDKILDTYNQDGTYDQDQLNKAVDEVKQEIADQMKVTTLDKVNAWRYLSMLGNPKTHIRNLVSNVAMRGTVAVKNAIARTIEGIAPIENRTKTWESASEEVTNFAKRTALEMKDVISGDSKYSETADIKAKREIFKNKVLEKLTNLNSDLLEKEDWWFSKPAFENSLSEFLTANGIKTEQDIQNNPEIIEKGKVYATEQAQIATFRQYSWLANKINDIERKNTATQIAVGAVLPFKKTPINIAKTGLSYSPIGALKALTYDISQVKQGKMEASTAIDHIAQGATGTALTLIGYMLAQMGFLNGAGDDDKEGKYDSQLGKQAYSINIGGNTYSLSWLSPVAMPLLVGANAYEQLVEGEEWNTDVVLETLGQTLDPLSEMSFLSSLDSVLSSYDSGVQRFFGIGEAMAQNYVTQFVPTASSQLAATLDDTKRSTKVSGDSNMKVLEETYNKLIYKIPGLRQTLEPTLDIWGNEVKQSENLLQRAFENFISPYSRKENIATELDEELKDLYAQTGDTGILPSVPYNYVNYDGERYDMSAEEFTDYKKTYGQTANDLLEDLFKTTTYKNSTSEDRAKLVNKVYDYARDEAKLEYLAKEDVEYTNAKKDGEEYYKENIIKGAIENDMTPEEYELYIDDPEEYSFLKEKDYSYRRKYFDTNESLKEIEKSFDKQKEGIDDDDELDALSSEKKASIVDSIINSGLEDTEKASLYKRYYNTDKIDIVVKSAISVDDYLTYQTKEFKADKNAKGNSIPGSRKDKVINYVNTLDLDIPQKAILIKSTNTFKFNDYNNSIVNYVDGLDLTYAEKSKILKELDMTIEEDGTVYWK